ncbi:MAG: glycoside hydrolase family 3 C-terminal domain-containing protein [Solobacterium sp.]|nr:glycoside hydrolase family 3 C-terminal domain-containing protein [Solobacterium sp.]
MKRVISGQYDDRESRLEKENREVAYRAALESFVLLKNNGCLPLKEKEVALFGVGAGHTIKGGTGSGETNNRHSVTIYEGLKNAGIRISSEKWIEEYDAFEKETHAEWIKEHTGMPSEATLSKSYVPPLGRALCADDISGSDRKTAVYVISRQSGEAADKKIDKGDYNLLPTEINDINFLYKEFENLVLVINSGTSFDLTPVDHMDAAVVFFGQAGQEGGRAFADVLTGKEYFSGKLTTTWARQYSDIPFGSEFSYLNNDLANEYYKEGIYVGYRYFDTFGVEPRFRFGYGLSYTEFEIETLKKTLEGRTVNLDVRVKNTGGFRGREIVQVYAGLPQGKLDREYQRLTAFAKTKELGPSEEETLHLSFDVSRLASYDENASSWILENGMYVIKVGNSSGSNEPVLAVENGSDIVLSRHEAICPADSAYEELKNNNTFEYCLENVERVQLDASCIQTEEYRYGKPEKYSDEKVDPILNRLNEEDLIKVCTGIGSMGMMDANAFCTPGVAGKTTYALMDKGLISVTLADGPTGLRLVRRSAVSLKGKIRMFKGDYLLSFMETMPDWALFFMKPRKNDIVFYQFATAFPVGTNLAQTWNEDIVKEVGYAVSREMNRYNVTYWLAPGMNIQRNPLCGRNFEYYSEDPLLSGKISAAMTRGVQSIEGNYTTIKHFACNNAEDNRQFSNSHVSERALREIYLKGFEINIREAGSKSVMTSYNMINGTYTPDSYDLCTKILRNEWGFDGVVMTDWSATRRGQGDSAAAISVGNDLIMPGDKNEIEDIRAGIKAGKLTEEDLRRAAANIIRSIVHSNAAKKYTVDDFIERKEK